MLNSEARKKHNRKYQQSEKGRNARKKANKKYDSSEKGRKVHKKWELGFEAKIGVPRGTMRRWANPEDAYLFDRRHQDKVIELYGVSRETLRTQGITNPIGRLQCKSLNE